MPRSGGIYSLPTNSWNPAINSTLATPADWQSLINDVASALTQSVSKDGQTVMTGSLNMGGFNLTNVASASIATFTGTPTINSPTLTGTPVAPTAAPGTNSTQVATTAFVAASFAPINSPVFTGTVTIPGGASISGYAPLASPALTGTPTAPTATVGTNTTQIATTAFVAATALAASLPGQTGNARKFITTDGTNPSWGHIFGAPSLVSSPTSANAGGAYVFTASTTLTLPGSPSAGDVVHFSNRSGTVTPVIGRNGQNIMGLAEDMTIDSDSGFTSLVFVDATRGWVFL